MDGHVVLVTGARRGIGRFLADHFAQKGASVVGCSREPFDGSIERYSHHIADVGDEADVKTLIAAVKRDYGRLDVVINNAGIASMNPALLTPATTIDRVLATNFRGTVLVCREAAKLMMGRRYGRIVNMSTVAVPLLIEGEALYAASKSAVVTYSQVLARELAPFGITVNVVGPAPIETDMIKDVPAEKMQRIVDQQAIKRLGRFEDVANVVDFFAAPESEYVTGQLIYLGGVS